MSQITTHVLNTSSGKPASGLAIRLERPNGGDWGLIAGGATNSDGRIADLLSKGENLEPGIYRMIFETGDYFSSQGESGFYPSVTIVFEITDDSHYHIPLLLSPFGYTTYRGS